MGRSKVGVLMMVSALLGVLLVPGVVSAIVPGGSTSSSEAAIYVPIPPCKIFAGITLDGENFNDIQTLEVTTVSGAQGADACALLAAPDGAIAASINLIAQSPAAKGNIHIGPAGGNIESVVNYSTEANFNNSTEVTVELEAGSMDIQARGSNTIGISNVVTAKGVLLGYWVPGTDLFESFDRIIVVSGAGTAAENGQELRTAVIAISGQGPSANNPWLVKLEPGIFDLGPSNLTLPDFVSIKGSGRTASKIVGTADNMIEPGQSAELSSLWIVLSNPSGDGDAVDINDASGVRILDARIEGLGGTAEAVNATDAFDMLIANSELVAVGNGIGFNAGSMTVRSSVVTSSIAALNALGSSGNITVEASRLEVLASDDVVAYQGGGNHNVSIFNSVMIGPDQTSRPGQVSDTLSIFNTYIDVPNAFLFNGTATCAQLSTPAPTGPNSGCL